MRPLGNSLRPPAVLSRAAPLALASLLALTALLALPGLAAAQGHPAPRIHTPRELDDRLIGIWVLDFQLTEQLSDRRLGTGDASIRLVFTPQPEVSPEDLDLSPELEAIEPLPAAETVRSAGRLAFGALGEGVYFVTGADGELDLHYVRETGDGGLGAPWTFRLTLQPKDPPRQDLLILGGSDRFDDPPLVYARRSRSPR